MKIAAGLVLSGLFILLVVSIVSLIGGLTTVVEPTPKPTPTVILEKPVWVVEPAIKAMPMLRTR